MGRSNVGKSSLINALVRQKLARTSGEPGKTRLANVYRIARGNGSPLHLVDLPGFGYARGLRRTQARVEEPTFDEVAQAAFARNPAALLLVDARHPGLESDLAAWQWVRTAAAGAAIVATKFDKLAHGERIRAMRQLESVFDATVLPVSAASGEGLDALWNLIDSLATRRSRNSNPPRKPTGHPLPKK